MAEIMGQGFLRTTNKKGGFLQEDVLNYVDELNGKIDELEKKLNESGGNSTASNENAVDNAVVEKLQNELSDALHQLENEKQKGIEQQKTFEDEKENLLKEMQAMSSANNGENSDNTELLNQLTEKDETIKTQSSKIQQAFAILEENKTRLEEFIAEIDEKDNQIKSKDAVINSKEEVIEEKSTQIYALNEEIKELKKRLAESGQSSATDMLGMIATITKTAQAEADKLKNDSEIKAKEVIDDANAKAEEILNNANSKAQAISEENNKKAETLNKLSETIKDMITTQLATVTENINNLCSSVDKAKESIAKAEECIADDEKLKEILPEFVPTYNEINAIDNTKEDVFDETMIEEDNQDEEIDDVDFSDEPMFGTTEETKDVPITDEPEEEPVTQENIQEEPKPSGKIWDMDDLATPSEEIAKPKKPQSTVASKWGMNDLDDLLKEVEASAPSEKSKNNQTTESSSMSDDWGIDIEALTKAVEEDANLNGDYNG